MSLTVEQKINLLILAGFEYVTAGGPEHHRLRRAVDDTHDDIMWDSNGWRTEFNHDIRSSGMWWTPREWNRTVIRSIPDDAIYQAIGAAP